MATIEITRDDLVVIAPQLPAGVVYDGSHLEIADADAENVEALIDDIANLRSAALKSSLLFMRPTNAGVWKRAASLSVGCRWRPTTGPSS